LRFKRLVAYHDDWHRAHSPWLAILAGGYFVKLLAVLRVSLLAALIALSTSLASGGTATATGLSTGASAVVTADWLNLRGGPGLNNPVISELPLGQNVQLLEGPIDGSWWRISTGSLIGYVYGDYLAPASAISTTTFDLELTSIWCDPADLESWVEYDTGKSLGPSYAAQQQFWNWELAHNDGFTVDQWDASPFAVASAAHQWMPNHGFNHFIYSDPIAATKMMAWLLANPNYREPSVATIWWGDHYVLVRGVRATSDPYLDFANSKILGVYVMDPNEGRPSWLGVDRYIPIDDWVTKYLTPVTYLTPGAGVPGDVWQGKYVTMQRDWTNDGPTPRGRVNATPADYLESKS
jgi:hypothetical protein